MKLEQVNQGFDSEAMVLERVVQKLAPRSEFTVAKGPVDEETICYIYTKKK
jgi:hypothetical protein